MRKQRRRSACSNCEADQRLCYRYMNSTIPLLSKSEISSLQSSSVFVQPQFVSDLVVNNIVVFHMMLLKHFKKCEHTLLRFLIISSLESSCSLRLTLSARLSFLSSSSLPLCSSWASLRDTAPSAFSSEILFWCSYSKCLTFCL